MLARWMLDNDQENPLLENFDRLLDICLPYNVTLSLGDGLRPGAGVDAGDAAQVKIWNQAIKDQDVAAMSNNDLLVVHLYAGTKDTGVFAERYPSSAVKPSGLGGSSSVGMPIDVTFGGTRSVGTATVANGKVNFTAE